MNNQVILLAIILILLIIVILCVIFTIGITSFAILIEKSREDEIEKLKEKYKDVMSLIKESIKKER